MSNHKPEFTIKELQRIRIKYRNKDIDPSHIDKNDLYSLVNFQNRREKEGMKPHEYRFFSLLLYCSSNDVPTQIYDGPSVQNKGSIIFKGFPTDNCATIFLHP
tara:strand:+ start:1508 stop:1816 length:309 start_codon:yes stop_codon:yes gene_type:complete